MNKLLSIIVPAYNVEKYIEECLDSLCIDFKHDRLEVLVIDDGATDNTLLLANKYVEKYPNIFKTIHKQNGGHGSVINRGIDEATGKYIKVVDGDDFLDKKSLLNVLEYLSTVDVDVVMHNEIDFFQGTSKQQRDTVGNIEYGRIYSSSEMEASWKYEMAKSIFSARVLKNKLYPRIDEKCFYVDQEFVVFTLPLITSLSAIDEDLYHYRLGNINQSVSLINKYKHRNDLYRVITRLLEYYDEITLGSLSENIVKRMNTKIAEQVVIYAQTIILAETSIKEDYTRVRQLYKLIKNNYPTIFSEIVPTKSLSLFIKVPNNIYTIIHRAHKIINNR